jgi:hypothetical protein
VRVEYLSGHAESPVDRLRTTLTTIDRSG